MGGEGAIGKDVARPSGVEDVDLTKPRSPEIYFGATRNLYLGNGISGKTGIQTFAELTGVKTNILYFMGDWDFSGEYAESKSANAKIIFRYQGEQVYMVSSAVNPIEAALRIDGGPLLNFGGSDVDQARGSVYIQDERLYRIIKNPSGWGEHTLEITVPEPGLKVFTFTFG